MCETIKLKVSCRDLGNNLKIDVLQQIKRAAILKCKTYLIFKKIKYAIKNIFHVKLLIFFKN